MRVTRQALMRQCAICERTVLMGERTLKFAPHEGDDFVDVCPLCQEVAVEHGWLKEGTPTTPTFAPERRRRRGLIASLFEARRQPTAEPVAPEPILRRLSERELAMVEAADLFNSSTHRRTIGGGAESPGPAPGGIGPPRG